MSVKNKYLNIVVEIKHLNIIFEYSGRNSCCLKEDKNNNNNLYTL